MYENTNKLHGSSETKKKYSKNTIANFSYKYTYKNDVPYLKAVPHFTNFLGYFCINRNRKMFKKIKISLSIKLWNQELQIIVENLLKMLFHSTIFIRGFFHVLILDKYPIKFARKKDPVINYRF